jgi:hypothetical protein
MVDLVSFDKPTWDLYIRAEHAFQRIQLRTTNPQALAIAEYCIWEMHLYIQMAALGVHQPRELSALEAVIISYAKKIDSIEQVGIHLPYTQVSSPSHTVKLPSVQDLFAAETITKEAEKVLEQFKMMKLKMRQKLYSCGKFWAGLILARNSPVGHRNALAEHCLARAIQCLDAALAAKAVEPFPGPPRPSSGAIHVAGAAVTIASASNPS